MDTQQPSQNSPNDSKTSLDSLHAQLSDLGVENPAALIVCVMGQNEMVMGQMYGYEQHRTAKDPYGATVGNRSPSVFEVSDFVAVENPVRLVRLMHQAGPGDIRFPIIFTDFDFVQAGVIELKPQSVFFLEWLDELSQKLYCTNLLNFLEGRRRAKLQAESGLVLPNGPLDPKRISNLLKDVKKG